MKKRGLVAIVFLSMISGALGGVGISWLLLSPGPALAQVEAAPGVLTARMFRLVNSRGQVLATLGADNDKHPGLVLKDTAGKDRLYLNLSETGPNLLLLGSDEKIRASLRLDRSGLGDLFFLDGNNRPRLGVSLDGSGSPKLIMADEAGTMRATMMLEKGSRPLLMLANEAGKAQASFAIHGGWGPGVFLQDQDQKPVMLFTSLGVVDPNKPPRQP
jgi:hypothetical protein